MSKEFITKFAAVITGAFSLLAALAWNETVKAFINTYIPKGSDLISLLIYAIIVTIIAVVVSVYLNKLADKMIKREEKLAKKLEDLKKEQDKKNKK